MVLRTLCVNTVKERPVGQTKEARPMPEVIVLRRKMVAIVRKNRFKTVPGD